MSDPTGPDLLEGAFRGAIDPVKVSPLYRLGLLLVATVMIVLPLIYVAIIGFVGFGTYHWATHPPELGGRGVVRWLLYLGPIGVGGILLVFMIKPLFASSSAADARCPVYRNREPGLWTFVEKICAVVGAPAPSRIHVDCNVNASASFRRGLASFHGDDLVLTIGLPLAASLSLRQFAGVLAHELGHFAQGTGMRLTYAIRGINYWFARVVYERDALDRCLERWSTRSDARLMAVLLIARLFIGLTRGILWILMMAGHEISCFMLRQMEFDADRYEARVAGSDSFVSTVRTLQTLGKASEIAQGSLRVAFQEGRLVDDLPRFIHSARGRLPEEAREEIETELGHSRTGLLDTHPSDRERIASVARENAPGIFRLEGPSTALFLEFEALCKAATRSFYRQSLGKGAELPELVPCDLLEREHAKIDAGGEALERYFRGLLLENRALRIPTTGAALPRRDPREAFVRLTRALQDMQGFRAAAERAARQRTELADRSARADQAVTLLDAGLRIRPTDFDLPASGLAAAQRTAGQARTLKIDLERELEPYFRAAEKRLASALELLPHPKLATRIEDHAGLVEEAPRLLASLGSVAPVLDRAADLRRDFAALTILLHSLEGNENNGDFLASLRSRVRAALDLLGELGAALEPVRYPFEHADRRISAGRYVLGSEVLDEDDTAQVYCTIQEALERLDTLYLRLLGRLVDIATRVEAAVLPRSS